MSDSASTEDLTTTDVLGRLCVRLGGRLLPIPAGGNGSDDNDDSGDGQDADDDADGTGDADDGDQDDTGSDDGDSSDDGDEKRFTQAELDEIVERRLARERRKHERALAKAGRGSSSSASSGSRTSRDRDTGNGSDTGDAPHPAVARAVRSEARAAAIAAGVPRDKAARFVRTVDLDQLEDFADVDTGETFSDDIEEAVAAALADVPEFAAAAGEGTGKGGQSGGDGMTGSGGDQPKTWSRKEIARLSDADYDKHADDILDAMRNGRIVD